MEKFMEEVLKIYNDNQIISWIIIGLFLGLVVLIIIAIVLAQKGEKEEVFIEEIKRPEKATNDDAVTTENKDPLPDKKSSEEIEEPIAKKQPTKEINEEVDVPVIPQAPKAKQATRTPAKNTRNPKGKFVIFANDIFYQFVLKASNGEVLITSDLYKTKASAQAGAKTLQENIIEGMEKIISQDKFGLWQFRFVQGNSRVVAISASYDTEKAAISAAESSLKFGSNAEVIVDEKYDNPPFIQIIDMDAVSKEGGKIVYQNNENVGFYFQLIAPNGVTIFTSEIYRAKASCKTGVKTLINNIKNGLFVVTKDKRDKYQFKLYASTLSRIIAVGESYKDKQQAIANAKSVATYIEKAV